MNNIINDLKVSSGIYAALLIIAGSIFLFAGIRFFKGVVASAAFLLFSFFAYSILEGVNASTKFDNPELAYSLILLAVGLIGAVIALKVWKVGLFSIGAMGGYALSSFILACDLGSDFGLIPSKEGRIIFLVLFMVLGGVAIFFFERPIIIVGTALMGANALLYGVDIYARTGYYRTVSSFFSGKVKYVPEDKRVLGILISFCIIVLFGIIVQFKVTGKGLPAYSKR